MSYNTRLINALTQMGLNPDAHLPVNGTHRFVIEADNTLVSVWVAPRMDLRALKHRVMCLCPTCGSELTFGRLPQHRGSVRCVEITLGVRRSSR